MIIVVGVVGSREDRVGRVKKMSLSIIIILQSRECSMVCKSTHLGYRTSHTFSRDQFLISRNSLYHFIRIKYIVTYL